jgi:hypothetical protein
MCRYLSTLQEKRMDREVAMHQMTERFQELYRKAMDAVDCAPDGQWITASEFVFRDVFQQLMKEAYEAAIQARIDAQSAADKAAFSPSGWVERGEGPAS